MIHTSRQLKALVRNLSRGNSNKAQMLIRNYMMERFLERVSVSDYRDNIILKGGVLVASMIGYENRSTMDIDTTLKGKSLSEETARNMVEDIVAIHIGDGVSFEIKSVSRIMDTADYPGVRVTLNTVLETMRTPLKIDFSTGDVITYHEVNYTFGLMFEKREISILAYNLETILAEKLETIFSRGTANTRMRDFYDIYALCSMRGVHFEREVLGEAFRKTSENRGSSEVVTDMTLLLSEIENSNELMALWSKYSLKYDYATGIEWHTVIEAIRNISVFLA